MPQRKQLAKRTSNVLSLRIQAEEVAAMSALTNEYYRLIGRRIAPNRSDLLKWALAFAADDLAGFARWLNARKTAAEQGEEA